jgi:NADPH2:quinone reductase
LTATSETAVPATMTAIAISEPGRPDVLKPETRPVPHPFEHEILIKVAAAGVNRPDVVQRQGHYPPPKARASWPSWRLTGFSAGVSALAAL